MQYLISPKMGAMWDQKNLDLDLLHIFWTIVEAGSISGAASQSGLSQPAVSQQLARLESQLGQRLIDRSCRPFSLTDAGTLLAQQLPGLLEPIIALTRQLREFGKETPGALRIVMADSLCGVMGAEFLSSVGKLAGSIDLRAGISPWIEESFRARKFDLGVDSPPFDPSTKADRRALFDDPFVFVCPAQYADKDIAQIMAQAPQVGYQRASKFGMKAASVAREMGATVPPRFTFDSTQPLLRFVQAGYGWAVTSSLCLFQSPAALEDVIVHPCRPEHLRNLVLLTQQGELEELGENAAEKLRSVFRQLVLGPWFKFSPQVSDILRAANPGLFDGHKPGLSASIQ
jgi:DNA-binding transcriptional LysR family regulator